MYARIFVPKEEVTTRISKIAGRKQSCVGDQNTRGVPSILMAISFSLPLSPFIHSVDNDIAVATVRSQ